MRASVPKAQMDSAWQHCEVARQLKEAEAAALTQTACEEAAEREKKAEQEKISTSRVRVSSIGI